MGDKNSPSDDFEPPDMALISAQHGNPFNTEPDSAMRQMAQSNWSCYCAHRQVGFNSEQAMLIVQTIVSTALASQVRGDEDD